MIAGLTSLTVGVFGWNRGEAARAVGMLDVALGAFSFGLGARQLGTLDTAPGGPTLTWRPWVSADGSGGALVAARF